MRSSVAILTLLSTVMAFSLSPSFAHGEEMGSDLLGWIAGLKESAENPLAVTVAPGQT